MADISTPHTRYASDYTSIPVDNKRHCHRTICWPAIFAGLIAALAFDVVLMMLSAGLGFAIYTPITDQNPIEHFSTGAIIITGFSAVVSLWLGGWVAGRLTPVTLRGAGWLHGLIVWCAATVVGVLLVSSGAGWALGDLSKLVGSGLTVAGKSVAAGVADSDVAKDAARSTQESLASFTEEALGSRTATYTTTGISAKREIGLAVARLFSPAQQDNFAANRTALITTLVDNANMSQSNAERIVNDWTVSYDHLKADLAAVKKHAEIQARKAADKISNTLAILSLCAFLGFVLGAIAASCGGCAGAKLATRREVSA